ncbi:hypothetical protein Tco_1419543 [Tanacetum coccineum]
MNRLIGNLCTIWIGRFHLHANVFRYERPRIPSPTAGHGFVNNHALSGSYASIAKDNSLLKTHVFQASIMPTLVLDDSCVIDRDLSRHVMGRVMIELNNEVTMQKLLQHIGVKSWFHVLQTAKHDFIREALDLEETSDLLFAQKRICIQTKQADNILEKFKVILKGKVFLVCAKELFTWTPTFLDCKESEYYSDNESLQGENLKHIGSQNGLQDLDVDSDVEGVFETVFGDKNSSPNNTFCRHNDKEVEQQSEDPFNLYDLLKQNPKGVASDSISSFSHPPGFIPVDLNSRQENIKKGDEINPRYDKVNLSDSSSSFSHPTSFTPVDLDPCQENIPTGDVVHDNVTSQGESVFHTTHKSQEGGSVLEVLDNMIQVGQSMGYAMEGCLKDFVNIIGSQGVDDVPQ